MNLRVNLLQDAEKRYQGPVSLRLVLIISGSIVGAMILLFVGVSTQRHFALRGNMRTAQQDWDQIEGRYNQIMVKQKELNANKALLGELALWTKTRPAWSRLLPDLQQVVPATIQLTRLGVRGEWQYIKPPVAAQDPSAAAPEKPEGEPAGEEKKVVEKPPVPARKFFVTTEGRAQGELADETVVQFVRSLRDASEFRQQFESVKLQRLARDMAQGGGDAGQQADRVFEVQGEFFLRKLE